MHHCFAKPCRGIFSHLPIVRVHGKHKGLVPTQSPLSAQGMLPIQGGATFTNIVTTNLTLIIRAKTSPHGVQVIMGCSTHRVWAFRTLKSYLTHIGVVHTSGITLPSLVLTNCCIPHKDFFVHKTKTFFMVVLGLDPKNVLSHSYISGSATSASQIQF